MTMLMLAVLFVLTGGAITYRIPDDITELLREQSQDDFPDSLYNEERLVDALSRRDNPPKDPISINEDIETSKDIIHGDIKLTEQMKDELAKGKVNDVTKRNAQRDRRYLWMNTIIPYEIDGSLSDQTAVIQQSIADFHSKTCLQFVQRTSQPNWIKFVKLSGCWSSVGRQYGSQGYQSISIGSGCEYIKVIIHEIMHALGFWHEQSRPDRDKYVEIFWENIQQDKQYNFDRSLSSIVDTLGVDYDYNSIVHYKIGAFSKSHKYTITAINDPQNSKNIGPGESLSPLDVVKINSLYSCPSSCSSVTSLGVENAGSLPSQNFQASSHSSLYPPSQGRLNSYSAWCEALSGSANQYLQIDLGAVKHLCAVETQGSGIFGDWVTTYSIHYSKDGVTWNQIQTNGIEKVYAGNTNQNTVVKNSFSSSIHTRYIRMYPKSINGRACLRVGLKGAAPFLSGWSTWTPCDRSSCKKTRQRFCKSNNKAVDCPTVDPNGIESQTVSCTQQECTAPIDGHWNRWSAWSSCTASCGLGRTQRTRKCDDPAPSNGGNYCQGNDTATTQCRQRFCGMGPDGCSFTSSLCTWKQDPFADIPWNRHRFSTPSQNTGPTSDHTSIDQSGYYIYLEGSYVPTGSRAVLRSPVQPGISGQRCLSFFYNMYDAYNKYMGNLHVKKQSALDGTQTTLKTFSGNKGNQWLSESITFSSSSDYLLVFEGVRGTAYPSDIAIDDVKVLWGPCNSPSDVNPEPNTKPSSNTIEDTCDFEAGFCTWQNAAASKQFDWTRNKVSTSTPFTGPSGDHTSKLGYYAYIETSSPRTIGQRARLQSKTFSQHYKCMSLWYNMNGNDVWQLNVIKKTSSKEILLWSANTNKGDAWLHGIVPLAGAESFSIIIEGVRGHGETGDIAIDDLVVARQTCSTLKPSTSNPGSGASCSFDGSYKQCAWIDLPEGTMYWLSHTGATPNANTGPSSAHSGSGGYYMYINSASPRKSGDKALIASPYISPGATGQCFKFWYHMHGSQVGNLNVYNENISSANRVKVFSKVSTQGNAWLLASIHITGNQQFRIVIEAMVGGPGVSDIAIDDVSFTNGSC